jgi:hypothetical protein
MGDTPCIRFAQMVKGGKMWISVWRTHRLGVQCVKAHELATVALVALLVPVAALAATPGATGTAGQDNVPLYVNYQGYLTDSLANPIFGVLPMTIAIYTDSSGGAQLYSSSQTVTVENGVFNVKLPMTPSDTNMFMAGLRRWVGLTVDGNVLQPRTEITTMAYAMHALYGDNADKLDTRHATQFIWNGSTMQASSDFYISGSGRADKQLEANATGLSNSAAVVGEVTGNNTGVYGHGVNGSGVYAESDNGHAAFAYASDSAKFGLWGYNGQAKGTGVAGSGCNDTLFYVVSGTGGAFSARHIGLFAYGHDTTGTGVATMGNRISDTVYTLALGSGGSFNGSQFGVYGLARNLAGDRCGGFFRTYSQAPANDSVWTYIGYNYGGNKYNVLGNGITADAMDTDDGSRLVFASAATSPYVEDFGTGRLTAGHCRVSLDPSFAACCANSDANPPLVFITLNDDCRGVYVKADGQGFDVRELGEGRSSAGFSYRVVGVRKGCADVRLPKAPAAPLDRGIAVDAGSLPSRPGR